MLEQPENGSQIQDQCKEMTLAASANHLKRPRHSCQEDLTETAART